jgi:acyl-CoA thioester hydrolase
MNERGEAILRHTSSVRVRYADTDKMGVVYNGNYLTFFEIGRTELLRAHGLPYAEMERAGYLLPVLEAKVRYHLPSHYDDVLDIEAAFSWAGAATIRMDYRLRRGDDAIAEGYTLHAFVSSETRRSVRPPRIFLDMLRKQAQE